MHNVVQSIHISRKEGKSINNEEIKELADRFWVPIYLDENSDRALKAKATNDLIRYNERLDELYSRILEIEAPFNYIGDNMVVSGRVDLIAVDKEGHLVLIDFKARKVKGEKDVGVLAEINVEQQLRMYEYCLSKNYNIDKLIAYTLMDQKLTEFEPDRNFVDRYLHEMTKRIEESKYERKYGAFCKKCEFRFLCGDNV